MEISQLVSNFASYSYSFIPSKNIPNAISTLRISSLRALFLPHSTKSSGSDMLVEFSVITSCDHVMSLSRTNSVKRSQFPSWDDELVFDIPENLEGKLSISVISVDKSDNVSTVVAKNSYDLKYIHRYSKCKEISLPLLINGMIIFDSDFDSLSQFNYSPNLTYHTSVDISNIFEIEQEFIKSELNFELGEKLISVFESRSVQPLKSHFQKLGMYNFPECEVPFALALVKHSGIVDEAVLLIESGTTELTLSLEMQAVWKHILQMRTVLRFRRQNDKQNSLIATPQKLTVEATNESEPKDEVTVDSLIDEMKDSSQGLDSDSDSIVWQSYDPYPKSSYKGIIGALNSYFCFITKLGYSMKAKSIYLSIEASGDDSLGPLQDPKLSKFFIEKTQIKFKEYRETKSDDSEKEGILVYELKNKQIDFDETPTFEFEYGESGYERIVLTYSNFVASDQNKEAHSYSSTTSDIIAKANFLLNLTPTYHDPNQTDSFKSSLRHMLNSYNQSFGNVNSFPASFDSEDNWKGILNVLKSNSKVSERSSSNNLADQQIKNQSGLFPSIDLSDIESNHYSKVNAFSSIDDNMINEEIKSPQILILQACSLFILSDNKLLCSENLAKTVVTRYERAKYRYVSPQKQTYKKYIYFVLIYYIC